MNNNEFNNNETLDSEYLSWDDEIKCDDEFTLLPEGDYDFTVKSFEQTRSRKGAPMAKVILKIQSEYGEITVVDNLVLKKSVEWKISSYFRSVGLKKHGEKVKMRWKESVGLKGRCHIIQDEFEDNNKKLRRNNKVGRYYDNTALADERLEAEINVEPTPW